MKGAFLGRDGWLYFNGGNEGPYEIVGKDGKKLSDHARRHVSFVYDRMGGLEYFANGASGVYELVSIQKVMSSAWSRF